MKKIYIFLVMSAFLISWAYAYTSTELQWANYLGEKGYIVDNSAKPADYRLDDNITRKEIMKIIAKLWGVTPDESCTGKFSDVANDWGCKYIEWALSQNIIAVNPTFRPDDNITKAEAMKMILNVQWIEKAYDGSVWQENYMNTAFDACIVWSTSGYNNMAQRGWIFETAYNTEVPPTECNPEDELEDILWELFDLL